jgi:F-type H+-transporting ATPase subunit epsilon
MGQLNCIVVTPEQTALEAETEFVALPLYDGEIGIAPGHSPMIGRLGYGEMRLTRGGAVERYYVDGGFVQVASNTVTVLTSRAIPAAKLNAQAAQKGLDDARGKPANTEELLEIRDRAVAKARAQLRVSRRAR